jgi:hypothetical protein
MKRTREVPRRLGGLREALQDVVERLAPVIDEMLFGGESLRSLESLVGKAERRARGEEPQADTPEVAVFSHLVRCGRSPRMCAVLEALDRDAARDVFWRLRLTQLQITRVWADRGYAGDRRGRRSHFST